MYKVKDYVIYKSVECLIGEVLGGGRYMIVTCDKYNVFEVHERDLRPYFAPKPRHTIRYTVYDNVSEKVLETFSSEKEAIEKCETLNKLSINTGDIFTHYTGTAVEVVNSTLEETEVMLEIAGSVYYSKYNTQQFLKEFTK